MFRQLRLVGFPAEGGWRVHAEPTVLQAPQAGIHGSKGIQGSKGIFELTWAANGRATFQYGPPVVEGERHIIWRRCSTHEVFADP